MPTHASRLAPLLLSVAILLVGHGLQLSVLPLRAEGIGWSNARIGLTSSFYFTGLLLGCYSIPALVRAVGHIRVFTVLTAIMTAALLGISMVEHFTAWLGLRLLTGWSIAGLYLVIESWLNEEVDNEHRGSLVSIYTVTVLVAMAGGQLLLNLAAPGSFEIVMTAALFVVLAAVPVGLTRLHQPEPVPTATFSPLLVLRTSRSAAIASFVGGVVTGCFYGLGPVYGKLLGLDVNAISIMMAAGILGGAVFLWPVGRLSDRVDRRRVILATMLAGIAVAATIAIFPWLNRPLMFFLFGGCILPIYALSLAHAGDLVESSFLEVGTGILIMNATGAILGPILAALLLDLQGAAAFFVFCAATLAAGALTLFLLIRRQPAGRPHFSPFELATTESAQGAVELDPRSDDSHR